MNMQHILRYCSLSFIKSIKLSLCLGYRLTLLLFPVKCPQTTYFQSFDYINLIFNNQKTFNIIYIYTIQLFEHISIMLL